MDKLGERNYLLLKRAAGCGNYMIGFGLIEEDLYIHEWEEIKAFCEWVEKGRTGEFENSRAFGSANYEERFAQFKIEYVYKQNHHK